MRILFLFFVFHTFWSFGQDLTELDKRNGFKDIKLGSPVDSIRGIKLKKEFKYREDIPAKLFTVEHPDYASIGEVKVNSIELKTYKDFIFEIAVHTVKDPRLMKAMESVLGKPIYDAKKNKYFWKSDKLILTFTSAAKNELELVYISYDVLKMMKADKQQKVEDISEDF